MAHAPNPTVVISMSVEPRRRVVNVVCIRVLLYQCSAGSVPAFRNVAGSFDTDRRLG
jgi:hypothetical protein